MRSLKHLVEWFVGGVGVCGVVVVSTTYKSFITTLLHFCDFGDAPDINYGSEDYIRGESLVGLTIKYGHGRHHTWPLRSLTASPVSSTCTVISLFSL